MIFMGILMLFASEDIKYKLTKKVSYSWLHRYQQHTVRIIANRLLMS